MKKENISVIVSFVIVVGVIILTIYILMNRNEKVEPLENINTNVTTESTDTLQNEMEQKILNNFTPVSSVAKLEKLDLVAGNGAEVKAGDTVSVHYIGAVAGTGVIFQSSKDFGTDPVTFPLNGVIKGWTDGIPGMKVGGTRRLVIPADMAYGANPPGGSGIPANADLVFDVELIAIK